jgi:hypothetical protein
MARICPRCYKSREATEKLVHKDGKAWLIEYCHVCLYNFELTEWIVPRKPDPVIPPQINKKTKRFRFGMERDQDD